MTVLRALQVLLLVVGCTFPACGAGEDAAASPAPAPTSEMPPGAPAYSPELKTAMATALAAKGETYEPRTHHLHEDGSPVFTNRLILESSPYLNQHAHNPVNWFPWGDEAFDTARPGAPRPVERGLLDLSLVPRHGARVVRGSRDRALHQRELHRDQG